MSIKKILISQKQPSAASPYGIISKKFGVDVDFQPFFKMEPLSSREFRSQKINVLDYTAVVFTARTTIDAFFQVCEELRIKIPETMKYFCTSEVIANYLQKHIVYRKRKIFFGDGTPASIMGLISNKHKDEHFLIVNSSFTRKDIITSLFEQSSYNFGTAVFVKPVAQDLSAIDLHTYDMVVLFNHADVDSIYENFPDFQQGDIKFASYGKSVVKAMEDAGISIEVAAPTPQAPSVAKALEIYLENHQ